MVGQARVAAEGLEMEVDRSARVVAAEQEARAGPAEQEARAEPAEQEAIPKPPAVSIVTLVCLPI